MPTINKDLQRKSGFFHSLGLVITKTGNDPSNEIIKSAHNVLSKEVWMETVPFALDFDDAQLNAINNSTIIEQIGTTVSPAYLYPLATSNYQTWFLDTGTPSIVNAFGTFTTDGFLPSETWVKPLISTVDSTNESGFPALGYQLRIYDSNLTYKGYESINYDVDYFSGLVRFDDGRNPTLGQPASGLPLFSASGFESALQSGTQAAIDYITTTASNAPRAIAWKYVGQTLQEFEGGGGSGTPLTVSDYHTFASFPNVSQIEFRGGAVKIDAPRENVLVTGGQPYTGKVTVWIPQPDYVDPFAPSLKNGENRYLSIPDSNTYSVTSPDGTFGVGDWESSFSTARNTFTNVTGTLTNAFNASNYFSVYDLGSTMSFYVYNAFDEVVSSIDNFVVESSGSTSSNGISITIDDFQPDADRYKAKASGDIDLSLLFPKGGRFKFTVTHYNLTEGDYTFSRDLFYDYPNQSVTTTSTLDGPVEFVENTVVDRDFSGVSFYYVGTNFDVTVDGINMINEISIPTGNQIEVPATNLSISANHGVNGVLSPNAITGWTQSWDATNLTYNFISSNISGTTLQYPSFLSSDPSNSNVNILNDAQNSGFTAELYDWVAGPTLDSNQERVLINLKSVTSFPLTGNLISNPLDGEYGRIKASSVLTGTGGLVNYDSSLSLLASGANDELQWIIDNSGSNPSGRIIFPQQNFTNFWPTANSSRQVDYSTAVGSNKTLTYRQNIPGIGTDVFGTFAFNGYRWHVTGPYGFTGYSAGIAGGVITFTSGQNITEENLHSGVIGGAMTPGTGDLVILLGLGDDTTDYPNKGWYFLSNNPDDTVNNYKGRVNYLANNLNTNNSIQFNTNNQARKLYLAIGISDTSNAKKINIKSFQIALS